MSSSAKALRDALSAFLESCGRDYEFPAGGQYDLLTKHERILFELLQNDELSVNEQISTLMEDCDWNDCYSLAIFGVRLAILADRRKHPGTYRIALIALVAGSPKVDSRDVLGAFAIFHVCGKRIGIDFQAEIQPLAACGDAEELRPTLDGFFSRDEEMRTVDVMGFQECGEGESLTYRAKSMFLTETAGHSDVAFEPGFHARRNLGAVSIGVGTQEYPNNAKTNR